MSKQIRGDDVARFVSKTVANGDCLEWTGTVNKDGYGKFMVGPHGDQKTWAAHRWAYAQVHGQVPPLIRHTCDNPRCVLVAHLVPGTQLDNVHDAIQRNRRRNVLDPSMVRRLRYVRESGESLRAEAMRMGISYFTAYQAATGKTWKHVV